MRRNDCPGMQRSLQKILDRSIVEPCGACGAEIRFGYGDTQKECPSCHSIAEKSLEEQLKDYGCAGYCANAEHCIKPQQYAHILEIKERIYQRKYQQKYNDALSLHHTKTESDK